MNAQKWSAEERFQVLATGVAPLLVSFALATAVFPYAGNEAFFVLVALVPLSYAALFFFVLPSLWLLRRWGRESSLSMAAVCGVATFAPWFSLYVLLFPSGTGKFSGAPMQVFTALALPALLAAVAGAVVHRLGAPRLRKNAA
jgi:hypothetical protein